MNIEKISAITIKVNEMARSMHFYNGLLVLLCYKQSQAPSVTKRAGGELLDKMSGNLNS